MKLSATFIPQYQPTKVKTNIGTGWRKWFGPLAAVLALMFAATGGARAQERQFADYNFAITPPDQWHMVTNMRTNKPGLLAVYADAKGHRSLDIVVKDGPAVVWNESSISGFEEGMHDHTGGERTSGKVVEVAGIRSYEREGFLFVRGTRISTIQLCITADGKMFLLEAIRSDGEVGDDTEIRQALSSFRFLRTPVQSAVPISPPFNMAAYEMGRKMGYLMGILVMLAVAAAIVYAVVRSIRTTRSSRPLQVPRPQMPPPLPPRLPPDRR